MPLYATPFTAALLQAKCEGEPGAPKIPVTVVPLGGRFDVGPFNVEYVSVAHSIPESNALIIRTPPGTVLHTGDWKIDPTPVIGPPTDEAKLRAIGDEGVLALIGDSTNAVREGRSPSESDVAKSLAELIRSAPARVAVTTFASNVSRLRCVAEAARACGREVVIVGRAMERIVQVARETGYFDGVQDFLGIDDLRLSAARQGGGAVHRQPGRAARRAVAHRAGRSSGSHLQPRRPGDLLLARHSGQRKGRGCVINGLVVQGVEVITDRTHLVHVSGHPRQAELEDMLRWVRPQIVLPVHGEALHMAEHAALARRIGVPKVATCHDGDVVRLAPNGPASSTRCRSGASTKTAGCWWMRRHARFPDRRAA